MNVLTLASSKYSIRYEKDREWDYRIFRNEEDVTEKVKNNITGDLFYEILRQQDVIEKLDEAKRRLEECGSQNSLNSITKVKSPEVEAILSEVSPAVIKTCHDCEYEVVCVDANTDKAEHCGAIGEVTSIRAKKAVESIVRALMRPI